MKTFVVVGLRGERFFRESTGGAMHGVWRGTPITAYRSRSAARAAIARARRKMMADCAHLSPEERDSIWKSWNMHPKTLVFEKAPARGGRR